MRLTRTALCLWAAAIAVACGDSERTASAPPPAEEPAAAPADERAVPAEEPVDTAQTSAPDPAQGAQQYQIFCVTCHGENGCGGGPGAVGLDPQPAKHCDGDYMNTLSDEHLFTVIKEGGPAVGKSPLMAPWGGTLTDAQIWDVVAYLRTIADPPYQKP